MEMTNREKLQYELEERIGSTNVYYNPPEGFKLRYPCVVYHFDGVDIKHANDAKYLKNNKYTLTLIDKDPESKLFDAIFAMPLCRYERGFTSENLSHYVFQLYY